MIDNTTGYTVSPKDHSEFALKLLDLLRDSKKCKSFGKEGRKHVNKKFSVEVITKQNIEFYKSLIKG